MKALNIITVKDIQNMLNVSNKVAISYYRDIKNQYDIKRKPCLFHLCKYLKIPLEEIQL